MRPPHSWKEFDVADRAARRAAGLENAEGTQQTFLICVNEIEDGEVTLAPPEDSETSKESVA